MRVISGVAKGKLLETLPGGDTVRPTTDRVKEALFSAIHFDLPNATVLDLFAGSGQLGIEALSRGASHAHFVDLSRNATSVINKNLSACGFSSISSVTCADYNTYLKNCNLSFDVAFIDPPYAANLFDGAINAVAPYMQKDGIIVCEHPINILLTDIEQFTRRDYKYGKIAVTIFRKEAD